MKRPAIRSRKIVVAILAVAAALAAFALVFDWNWLKRPLERAITDATGRRFEIAGRMSARWTPFPTLRMEQVWFANPAWASKPALLQAQAVEIRPALLLLLLKRVHLHELTLVRPQIALERTADGRATWRFDREQRDPDRAPQIGTLRVEDGEIDYRDAATDTQLSVQLENADELRFSVKGRFRAQAVEARGTTAALLALQETSRPFPLTVSGTVAGTRIRLAGELAGLARFDQGQLRYEVRGASLRQLAPVFGAPLPETPPYVLSGQLTHEGARWTTTDLKGRVGNSDVSGSVTVTTGGVRPMLEVFLNSRLLDLADLGPLVGAGPAATTNAANDPARVLPTRAFDLSRVSGIDAHVILKAGRVVRAAEFPFDDFMADFRLQDSQITIDPLKFGFADGRLQSRVTLDARQPVLATHAAGQLRGVSVARIFPAQATAGAAAGTLAGVFDVRGRGNSISAMLAGADGRATLLFADGRVPSLLPALADLDGARVLGSLLKGRQPESVYCAAIDVRAERGRVTPNVAIFETETTVLNATGTLDLHDESLDLRLAQAPKRPSFLSLRTPIVLQGTLRSPHVGVDAAPLAVRGAAAVVLGLINPLAAVFALIETGPGEDGTCPEIRRGLRERRAGA